MTSDESCYVYIVLPGETDFVTAGRLQVSRRDRDPVGRFVYGRSYRERPDAVELDPVELRLRAGTFETARFEGVFGAIRDAMPDDWGRRVIERNAGATALSPLDYLYLGADDRAGALGFGPNVAPPPPTTTFNRTLDLARLQSAADAILRDEPGLAGSAGQQVEVLMLLGTSMGGARPKTVVEHDGALWLAKLRRPDDRWNHPRVEHGMLRLAARCGLNVADSRLETIGHDDVLLVRRFDRAAAPSGYFRHRMVSALTMLQASDDVTDRRKWSYLGFADELRRSSATPKADLHELFGRMCFNAAVSNLDDHPRNHAMLAEREWRLSPAYDLTPSPVTTLDNRDLAMACGPFGRKAHRSNLIGGCGRFLLSEDDASATYDRIVSEVGARWRETLRDAGVTELDCARVERAFVYPGLGR